MSDIKEVFYPMDTFSKEGVKGPRGPFFDEILVHKWC